MIFSKTVGYALQTAIFLSNRSDKKPAHQKEIAEALDIPHHYLGKILQPLTRSGIIGSKTGAFGGFYLAKPADDIVLCDIVTVFETADFFEGCVLGFPGWEDSTPCAVHKDWRSAKVIIQDFMTKHTLAEWGSEIDIKLDYIKSLKTQKK